MRHFLFFCLLKKLAVLLALLLLASAAIAAQTIPKFIQGNYAVPQTPQTSITVPYTAAQTAGDLNVVVVGWSDSTARISSLKDSHGNIYRLAVGPMVTGTLSQAIYYAKNIPAAAAAAANVVTVTFSTAAAYPDIRIMEYRGIDPINPLDTFVGATGFSAASSSGAVTTTSATDLLVGANMVSTLTTVAGSGFTLRLLTEPDGDMVEDRIVTATGSSSASAPLTQAGDWVMQMVAFRAASTSTPTPAPTPTPTPKPTATPIPRPVAYVQGNYAAPQTPQTAVVVPYTAVQTAGNLNVVIVGWNDSSAKVSSLTDSNGNAYQLGIGPTAVTGALSQSIYYAKNIAAAKAGANAVTVKFGGSAAKFPDIRILEYGGINAASPLDAVAGTTNDSSTSSSGSLTTKNASDLLVGANTVQTSTTGAGSGFTRRLLTNPDGDLAEERITTSTGSYSASAPLTQAGHWVMQMVAFRSASSGSSSGSSPTDPTPTPKPTATPTPKPTATPTPSGKSVTLAWDADAATSNSTTNPKGYRLHLGTTSGHYTQTQDVGTATSAKISSLTSGSTYYFAVTAYNSSGVDGPYSSQVTYKAP